MARSKLIEWVSWAKHSQLEPFRPVSGKAPVASKQAVVGPSGGKIIDLTPTLMAHTHYEVVVDKTNVIGSFSTGSRVDAAPPSWAGTTNGVFGIALCSCPCSNVHYAHLRIATPSDDMTSSAEVTFGAWTANAAGAIDYTRAPDFYVDADDEGRLMVGRRTDCTPATVGGAGSAVLAKGATSAAPLTSASTTLLDAGDAGRAAPLHRGSQQALGQTTRLDEIGTLYPRRRRPSQASVNVMSTNRSGYQVIAADRPGARRRVVE